MTDLAVDYKDAILAESMNGKRRLKLTDLGDGVYEVEDVTEYSQEGSLYGANEINTLHQAMNDLSEKSGTWIGGVIIPAGSTSVVISNSLITETSIVDIYPKTSADEKILKAARTSWSQETGKVTLNFQYETTAECILQNIIIRNVSGEAPIVICDSRTVGAIEQLQMASITGLTSEVTVDPVTE